MNYFMNLKISASDPEILRNFLNHIHDESNNDIVKLIEVEELDQTICVVKTDLRKGINKVNNKNSILKKTMPF